MQKINLMALQSILRELPQEDAVPTDGVNQYLMEHVIEALINGKKVCYGDLDYSRFDDIDLRRASGYCEELRKMEWQLGELCLRIGNTDACPSKRRGYC